MVCVPLRRNPDCGSRLIVQIQGYRHGTFNTAVAVLLHLYNFELRQSASAIPDSMVCCVFRFKLQVLTPGSMKGA